MLRIRRNIYRLYRQRCRNVRKIFRRNAFVIFEVKFRFRHDRNVVVRTENIIGAVIKLRFSRGRVGNRFIISPLKCVRNKETKLPNSAFSCIQNLHAVCVLRRLLNGRYNINAPESFTEKLTRIKGRLDRVNNNEAIKTVYFFRRFGSFRTFPSLVYLSRL